MADVGRPSLYDPAYCEQVIEWGKEGKSKAWMASRLGVTRMTLTNWADEHPEFLDAMAQSAEHAQSWWEDAGQDHMLMAPGQGTFNASVWSRSMAARFPADWREKSEQTVSGPDGAPLISVITRKIVDTKPAE